MGEAVLPSNSGRPLMAKSVDARFDPGALTLAGHSIKVARAAKALHSALGSAFQRAFGFSDSDLVRLCRLSTLAALFHDIGKASASFQATVRGESREKHPWRHEFLSAGALHAEDLLGRWLREHLDSEELALVGMMVAGHHLRATREMSHPRVARSEQLLLASPELLPIWRCAAEILDAESTPEPRGLTLTTDEGSDLVTGYVLSSRRSDRDSPRGRGSLLPVGKAAVIAADIVGSAHVGREPVEEWIPRLLGTELRPDDLREVVDSRLEGAEPRDFQQRVAASDAPLTVVTAGCGNGKTIAAYLWAVRRAAGGRLAFCYPTTGTTSSGFADYLLAQSHLERRLLHGRARVDVEAFERSPDDDEPLDLWAPDVLDRWGAQVVACTADTVLGLMTNWRTALAALPLWAQCAFVFDEVHSYDRNLFGHLLTFLSVVRAPTLVMTASLSPARRNALEAAAGAPLRCLAGDPAIERAPRYRLESSDEETAVRATYEAVRAGRKVLWVCNTVRRAQCTYRELRDLVGPSAARLYHSRFRYGDRVERQAEVIARFRAEAGTLVVATQVCEMSLDLSADLLVTELAPFPALVQRLGRLNRREPIPKKTRPCLCVEPPHERPYARSDMGVAREVVSRLRGRDLSQRDLADALAELHEEPYEPAASPFLYQTWRTEPTPLREASPGITIVRRGDVPTRPRRADVIRMAIGMPARSPADDWTVVPGAYAVPDEQVHYSPEEGASWAI